MTTAKIILLAVLAASLLAQTTPSNIGPTPPPRVNDDLSMMYYLNAPNAKEVLLADTAVSPGPPGRPVSAGDDGMWSVTTPPYEPGTHLLWIPDRRSAYGRSGWNRGDRSPVARGLRSGRLLDQGQKRPSRRSSHASPKATSGARDGRLPRQPIGKPFAVDRG